MLKRDEEEILKVLLKLYEEQGSAKVTGTFTVFPVKYQIVYKEILLRLQEQKYITDFEDVMAEDFLATLLPPAISYFDDKPTGSTAKTSVTKSSASGTSSALDELDALISLNGGTDTETLKEIAAEIREFCQNLIASPTVQPRKVLYGKIEKLSVKYSWLKTKIAKALGFAMMDILKGK